MSIYKTQRSLVLQNEFLCDEVIMYTAFYPRNMIVNSGISIYLHAFHTHTINVTKLFNHVNYKLTLHT